MKKILFVAALFLLCSEFHLLHSQNDTVTVQTLTFSDITKRRGTYLFPPATEKFRRIIMYQTLKCDAATTQDQYACGEWDYLTYQYVYKHTGQFDSTLYTHPYFITNGNSPSTFNYVSNPVFNYYQNYQWFNVIDSTISESNFVLGPGSMNSSEPLKGTEKEHVVQYLILASELSSAGITAGLIQKIGFYLPVNGGMIQNLKIGYKSAALSQLSTIDTSTFANVYQLNTAFIPSGQNTLNLLSPINWDGTSNLILEISFNNTVPQMDLPVLADDLGFSCTASAGYDAYMKIDNGKYIDVPLNNFDFGNEITVSFWANGDTTLLPNNNVAFSAIDSTSDRSINLHFPWSDQNVYWDAGSGSGYDRINKLATTAQTEGNWNHWAFTKNSANGTMNIYLNGHLWHTGTGKNKPVGVIKRFRIGNTVENWNAPYYGKFDDFCVWNKELDSTQIQQRMFQNLQGSDPLNSNLVFNYRFNELAQVQDYSGNNRHALIESMPEFNSFQKSELFKNINISSVRPQITFSQGNYVSHTDSVLVLDSALATPSSYTTYEVSNKTFVPLTSQTVWTQNMSYIYGTNGNIVDSIPVNQSPQSITNNQLIYYGPAYEIVDRFEIGRFITPYGINLSLGVNGFRWAYDVTDYAFLLHDSVDLSAGNQQELIDLKFVMIKGIPPADVKDVTKIWGNDASYSYYNLDVDTSLKAKTLTILPTAERFKIRSRITGHGHNNTSGNLNLPHCCEWKDNDHYLFVNSVQAEMWKVFRYNKCALNPVYPQGGTWPGAREGWCPGDVVDDHETDITSLVSGNSISVDYDISSVPINDPGMGGGNYVIAADFIQYGAPNHNVDAEITEVVSPNNWGYNSRVNPLCYDPKVVIRNNGSGNLTSVKIAYGVSGGVQKSFQWTGNLGFLKTDTVQLPVDNEQFWLGDSVRRFTATVSEPNAVADQYADNDTYTTKFNLPDIYVENFVIVLKTNNRAYENSYTIKDVNGNVVFSKSNLANQTTYTDTMNLAVGCYTFELTDLGNDGLKYWADTDQGTGSVRFRKMNTPASVKTFQAEFGRTIKYSFTIGGYMSLNEPEQSKVFEVYPNPSSGNFNLDLVNYNGPQTVYIYDLAGKLVFIDHFTVNGNILKNYSLLNLKPGVYTLQLSNHQGSETKKIVVR